MIFLILTIVLTATLIIAFTVFDKLGIDRTVAIVANYWTCVVCGSLAHGGFPVSGASLEMPWAWPALGLGALFFSLFNLIGWCTVRAGVAATSVANKLSMVIPIAASVWLYGEDLSLGKICGVVLAIPAVYLTTRSGSRKNEGDKDSASTTSTVLGLAVVFVGSGVADSIVKWMEATHLRNAAEQPAYLAHVFFAAAVLGTVMLAVRAALRSRKGLSGNALHESGTETTDASSQRWLYPKSIFGGVLLGIPNYFSIYTLIRLFQQPHFLQSSAAIPVVNIGVVIVSTAVAVGIFREHLLWSRLIGLGLSLVALLLIALSDLHG